MKIARIGDSRKYRDSEPISAERWERSHHFLQNGRRNRYILANEPKSEAPTLASVETNYRKSAGNFKAIQHSEAKEGAQ